MNEMKLDERTFRLLEEALPGERNVDVKVRRLLESEYLRCLGVYHHTDRTLSRKYEMTFQEFIAQRIVQQKGYTTEVETDAMDWETSISGIETIERKLQEIRKTVDVQHD